MDWNAFISDVLELNSGRMVSDREADKAMLRFQAKWRVSPATDDAAAKSAVNWMFLADALIKTGMVTL